MTSKNISVEDLAKDIDGIFSSNRMAQEEKLDLQSYMRVVNKEVTHHVLCKSSNTFELWPKLKKIDNLVAVVNELEKTYPSSGFTVQEYDSISNFIKCSISESDADAIRSSYEKEVERYTVRSNVLKDMELHRKSLQSKYQTTMTLLNQKALELQESHEKRIREIKNEQAIEKIKLDAIISDTPKQYKTEINELDNKISMLRKCSHGFLYEGTVFAKN